MNRLAISVEGSTEEEFVKSVLADHLRTARVEATKAIARYQKPLDGPLVAMQIGLDAIRAQCPRFHDWVTRLESLT